MGPGLQGSCEVAAGAAWPVQGLESGQARNMWCGKCPGRGEIQRTDVHGMILEGCLLMVLDHLSE